LYVLAIREDLRRCAVAQTAPPSVFGVSLLTTLHLRGQERIERCLAYVSLAIVNGDTTDLPNHPRFRFLCSRFVFPDNLQAPPGQPPSALNLCLIDPVELPD
jgi:hypothetical protein